jgi:ABC-type sugar transport system permease subunit/ABC-type glycerol-3-phosphate transport system substrate-binding protein
MEARQLQCIFRQQRRGQIPLWMASLLGICLVIVLAWWTIRETRTDTGDDRQPIVFWNAGHFGEDIYTVIHQFEQRNPEYRVIIGTAAARDFTGDAQRLLTAIAGGVPPDIVFFDRFAIGEWASRGALEDLTPYLENQDPDDPYPIDLDEYYDWSVAEASYVPPGSNEPARVFGIPTTADIRILFSNSNLLRQAGKVDEDYEPVPPQNWDELRQYANDLTEYDARRNIIRLGFAPNFGNSWLYIYAWQAGGELLSADRTRVTMDSPPVVRALQYMVDVYDDLGGFARVNAYQQGFQGGALDPFVMGQIAMKIDGDWALENIGDWAPHMDFILSPAPMPADQLALGREPITWAGGWSLIVPVTSQNKDGAFKLIQYITSWEAMQLLEQGKRERKESEGRLFLPRAQANRVQYERIVQEAIYDNPDIPPRISQAYDVLREMMPRTLIRPVSPVGQLLWNQHVRAYDAAVNHELGVEQALAGMQVPVQRQLDQILQPPPPTRVNWTPWFIAYGVLVVLPFLGMIVVYHRRRKEYGYKAREVGAAMLFASPWIIGFVVFVGGPILFSIIFSFARYDVLNEARYVGVDNYRELFGDRVFYTSLWNTSYMIVRIPLVMALSLAIAMLLNRAIKGMGFYRTTFYLPAVMPLVAASLLWIWLFNPSHGALNQFLTWMFDTAPFEGVEWLIQLLGFEAFQFSAPNWLNDKNWSKPALIVMGLWTAGGGMIIWLAGLQSIPSQLYEAAAIDGAGPWKQFCHVTIPMLSPYILFNAIIGLIGTMQIFQEAYIMTAGGPADSTLFYAFYLFRQAFQYFNLGYASAMAWILFLIVLALTLVQLWLSKRWVHYEHA